MAKKFNFLNEQDFVGDSAIQEMETSSAPADEVKEPEQPKAVEKTVVEEEEAPTDAVEVEEEQDFMPAPTKAEAKPAEKATEKTSTRRASSKKKPEKDLKADFLQIDIRGMRDYLSTITSYEAMRTGDKVSFNTYIRSLIEKDMKKNAATYESFKRLFEDK